MIALLLFGGAHPAHAASPGTGTLSGKLKVPAGIDASRVSVYAFSTNGRDTRAAVPRFDGSFTILDLPPAEYQVAFGIYETTVMTQWFPQKVYQEDARKIPIIANENASIGEVVILMGARVSGRVTVPASLNASCVRVTVEAAGPFQGGNLGHSYEAAVDANGNYSLSNILPGPYLIKFECPGALVLGGTNLYSEDGQPKVVNLAEGQNLSGANAEFILPAAIRGRVTVPAGVDPSQLYVWAYEAGHEETPALGSVSADGQFSIGDLRAGTYRLKITDLQNKTLIVDTWYGNAQSRELAKSIALKTGQSMELNDAISVFSGGGITGTISSGVIRGYGGVSVSVLDLDGNVIHRKAAESNGTFILGGITPGTYKIAFEDSQPSDFQRQFFPNIPDWKGISSAKALTVTAGKFIQGIDANLAYKATLGPSPVPTISGTGQVGRTLTANAGTWGPAPVTLGYQWYRSGVAIAGAGAGTYTLAAADAGRTISVGVTGSKAGYLTVTKNSAPTTEIAKGSLTGPVPAIAGTPRVAQPLTATLGNWAPSPASFRYQWYRAGVLIVGATAATYTPTASDVAATLSVKVTASKSGYSTVSKTSAPTTAVAKGSLTRSTPTVTGTPMVGSALAAAPGIWGPGAVTLRYQWYRSGAVIIGANAATYTPVTEDLGTILTVKVTGSKTGFTTFSRTSAPTAAVVKGSLIRATPTITGTAKVGSTLTANPGTWGPSPVTLRYQWYRSGVAITGATAATYKPVTTDAAKTLTVKVTGSKSGFTTFSRTSAPTAVVAK